MTSGFSFRTLVVDDAELYTQAIGRELWRKGIPCDLAYSGQEALQQVDRATYNAILLDHRLPDTDGIDLIPQLLSRQPNAVVVMMTAFHTIPNAVTAIRRGAEDYVIKETNLEPLVERVLEIKRREELRSHTDLVEPLTGLIGASPETREIVDQLQLISRAPETMTLITGETGVGKEVAARHLHNLSAPDSPMVTVDCVALSEANVDILLFGEFDPANHEILSRGAFERAGEGTLFLDEVGDLALPIQGKLLRVLESRTFHRVGELEEISLRARVVAATHRDLNARIAEGRFRLDLFQRLCVFPIHLPPLRDRREDILPLAEHFLRLYAEKLGKESCALGEEIDASLLGYDYPGNIRELRNIIERALILAEGDQIDLKHLPHRVLDSAPGAGQREGSIPFNFIPGIDTLESLERRMIIQAMRKADNVKTEAARLLGISRYQLLRRLEKYGIQQD